jgi:hypothetical protein
MQLNGWNTVEIIKVYNATTMNWNNEIRRTISGTGLGGNCFSKNLDKTSLRPKDIVNREIMMTGNSILP